MTDAPVAVAPTLDEWIPPIDQAAYYGLAGDYVRLLSPQTEADPVALLTNFLVTSGSMFGRESHAIADGRMHYPSEFLILVGHTGKSRKGTSAAHTLKIANQVRENFSKDCVLSGLSSGEGLVKGVSDGKKLGLYQFLGFLPEFGGLLTVARREGNNISAILRQSWDCDPLRVLTKQDPLNVSDYCLAIIGHITPPELLNGLSSTDMVNGLANRFLFVKVRRSQFLPEGGQDVDTSQIVKRLHSALQSAQNRGRLGRDDAAKELWAEAYPQLAEPPAGLKGELCARGDAHTLRLSLIYALLDGAGQIQLPHLQAALAVWRYCEASVASIFAARLGDTEADKILRAVASGPRTLTEMHKVFGNHQSSEWLLAKLAALVKAGHLVQTMKQCDRKV